MAWSGLSKSSLVMSPAKCCCVICKSCMERSPPTRLMTCPASPNGIVRPILLDVYNRPLCLQLLIVILSAITDQVHILCQKHFCLLNGLTVPKRDYLQGFWLYIRDVSIALYPGLPHFLLLLLLLLFGLRSV